MIADISENIPHEVSEVICLKCLNRWIAVYPEETPLKSLQCKCGEVGYVIKTGQTMPQEDSECKTCEHFKDKCTLGLSENHELYCGYWESISK